MERNLPLWFGWKSTSEEELYLRTAMMFKLEQFRSDPVKRCHNHMAMTNKRIDPKEIKHVVHCVNHPSIYEEKNEHLSILSQLQSSGSGQQHILLCFEFLCKNSCPSGMNRRPTELVFTLENNKRVVLGRRKLLVRVCSCPKRDKQKEETERVTVATVKKRKLSLPPSKNISSGDKHVYPIQINVVGKENYLAVLKSAYDIMAGHSIRTGQYESFKPFLDDILRQMP